MRIKTILVGRHDTATLTWVQENIQFITRVAKKNAALSSANTKNCSENRERSVFTYPAYPVLLLPTLPHNGSSLKL